MIIWEKTFDFKNTWFCIQYIPNTDYLVLHIKNLWQCSHKRTLSIPYFTLHRVSYEYSLRLRAFTAVNTELKTSTVTSLNHPTSLCFFTEYILEYLSDFSWFYRPKSIKPTVWTTITMLLYEWCSISWKHFTDHYAKQHVIISRFNIKEGFA